LEVKDYFIFLVFGKVAIYFLQTFSSHINIKWKFLQEMLACDMCTGFWIFTVLCFVFRVNLVEPYFIGVSEVLTGAVSSFIIHLICIGYKDKFGIVQIFSNKEE
jgi:hypothetical protein